MFCWWLFLTLFIGSSIGKIDDVCSFCNCTNRIADCSSKHILNHFNSSVWEGKSFEKVFYDNNNVIHLRPLPAFSAIFLSFKNNKIAKIEERAFQNVENLTVLDLSDNFLTSDNFKANIFIGNYKPESFLPLEYLQELRLSDNALHTLSDDIFTHLPNLKILLLNSNPLGVIDSSTIIAIGSTPQLEVLDLSSTMLSDLPMTMFHPLRHLKVLNISNNQFTSIPSAIGQLHSLVEVVLDGNHFEEITDFPSLENLKILRINNMRSLKAIKNHSLSKLNHLEEFHCSRNMYLEEISATAFWSYSSPPAEGQSWPPLKKVHISHNNVGRLERDLVGHWEGLESFDFRRNPVICDCENQWLVSTLVPIIESKNLSHLDGLTCGAPVEMAGKSLKGLSDEGYKMRCLDSLGHRPERDASLLIALFIGLLLSLPLTLIAIFFYRRRMQYNFPYSRAFYRKTESRESFQY